MTDTELDKLSRLRIKLGTKAKQEPKFRFYILYVHIYRRDVLEEAWKQVKMNGGAPGVDGVSIADIIASNKECELIDEIQKELKSKTYRPSPVKRVYIPKPNGKLRPLGIPVIKDRIIQTAAKLVLEPIFESDFLDSSFGFRSDKSAHQALDVIQDTIKTGRISVYDADLKGYFDSIPHDKLMSALKMRIADGSMLKLIKMWLRAPIQEKKQNGKGTKLLYPKKGTPQGGVISPLLANLFLHYFDKIFHSFQGPHRWAGARMVRYADDFIILAKYLSRELVNFIEYWIEERMGLEINREKTTHRNLHREENLEFLGYSFRFQEDRMGRGHHYLEMVPSDGSIKREMEKIKELTDKKYCWMSLENLIQSINNHLRGWKAYFSKGYPKRAFRKVNWYVHQKLVRHCQRRSQRRLRPPEGVSYYRFFQDLGLMRL